jgi:hypothetical protein
MRSIETMSWTGYTSARILFPEFTGERMFPQCANTECSAVFGNIREGNLFRFRRVQAGDGSPANSHSVEHAWLCAKCSKTLTVEFRNNQVVLFPLAPVVPAPSIVMMPLRKRRRRIRPVRRGRSRRRPPASPTGPPVVVLAIKPAGDFPDRS